MNSFEFYGPAKVIFGKEIEEEVGEEIQDRDSGEILVHSGDTCLYENGTLGRIRRSLSGCGIGYVDLGGMVPNPRPGLVKKGTQLCRKEGISFILAINGGGLIDSARGTVYRLINNSDVEDLLMGCFITNRIAPLGCISTIAATDSETSNSMVVTIKEGMFKHSCDHDCARPLSAIINPELTYTLPPYQTTSGATNIMMRTMERHFTNTEHIELIDRMAKGLLVSIRKAALLAIKGPDNYNARTDPMWVGSLSHNDLTDTGRVSDFASYRIGHEMGDMFDVACGAGFCTIWRSWVECVYKINPARSTQFTVNVFDVPTGFHGLEGAALEGIEAWEGWYRGLNMPTSMTELGIQPTEGQIGRVAEKCVATRGGHVGFFRTLYKDDVIDVCHIIE